MSKLKVLSYNILEGLQHSKVQIDVFAEWVTQQNPDITFYQELNGWTEENFAALAARCGHPFAVKIKEDGYRMGISSKREITEIKRMPEGFTLGCIYAKVGDYHLYAVHLNPFEEELRMGEIEKLLAHTRTLPDEASIMIVGDFNSLARSDKDTYGEEFQKHFFADKSRTRDTALHFHVTDKLLEAGFVDAYKLHHDQFKVSCPTLKRFFQEGTDVRIDYAFLSPALKEKCASAEIVHDKITRFLSDHYPLVITLDP